MDRSDAIAWIVNLWRYYRSEFISRPEIEEGSRAELHQALEAMGCSAEEVAKAEAEALY